MSGLTAFLAALLSAAATALLLAHRGPSRLNQVLRGAVPRAAPGRRGRSAASGLTNRPVLAGTVAGLAVALLVAPPVGPLLALAVVLAGPRLLGGLEPAAVRAERMQLTADLPLVLDLLSACLTGGASLPAAARVVARAVPGPAGRRLALVCAELAVGSPPAQAWAALTSETAHAPADGIGRSLNRGIGRSIDREDPLAPAARALGRAAEGGAPVAAAVARLAEDARAVARAEGERAARKVGVMVVAPLGLCFLPAFMLLGVVPVVAGLVGPLLRSL